MNNLLFINPSVIEGVENFSSQYLNSSPYPHIVIDNFLSDNTANYLYENFPSMSEMPNIFREPMSFKGQLSDIDGKWPKFSSIFKELQSQTFRNLISRITQINDLRADDILAGGGLHQSPSSGFLDIHIDANYHPLNKSLHRRINIIIYINKFWEPSWGGNLEIWSDLNHKPNKLIHSIQPLFNRAVIFSTSQISWHGVTPIHCPEGISRKSLALYYYTPSRPDAELYEDSSVIWMSKTSIFKKVFYPALNFAIRQLKPYAKYIRRNVFDAKK
jgi:hypothetical protein